MAKQVLRYDYDVLSADGTDNLTQTIMDLLNSYPELAGVSDGHIAFSVLELTKGIGMFPSSSVAVLNETEDVTGHVEQLCAYGFTVVFRTRSAAKERVKEWLDNLGRWLEQTTYPVLDGDKVFKQIKRTTQSYRYATTEDKAEDWAISLQATYTNEFDRR